MNKKVVLSGCQPSGQLSIGNYFGAIKNWAGMQEDNDCLYMIVDQHAITVRQKPDALRNACLDALALYMACGINPEKSNIFIQSHVPEHAQLSWVLNCYTQMGELNRMTQFKDKSLNKNENVNVGLYGYPVLMASDILIYQSDIVPVGGDQKQHIELARNIANRFNNVNGNIFKIPEPYISESSSRIMSLQEPKNKMSKSDENQSNFIGMLEDHKSISKKFKRAMTDSDEVPRIIFDKEAKPGISNLLSIMSASTGKSIEELSKEYEGKMYGQFKADVAESVIETLDPIQRKFKQFRSDQGELERVMAKGSKNAREKASETLEKVYDAVGFIRSPY